MSPSPRALRRLLRKAIQAYVTGPAARPLPESALDIALYALGDLRVDADAAIEAAANAPEPAACDNCRYYSARGYPTLTVCLLHATAAPERACPQHSSSRRALDPDVLARDGAACCKPCRYRRRLKAYRYGCSALLSGKSVQVDPPDPYAPGTNLGYICNRQNLSRRRP